MIRPIKLYLPANDGICSDVVEATMECVEKKSARISRHRGILVSMYGLQYFKDFPFVIGQRLHRRRRYCHRIHRGHARTIIRTYMYEGDDAWARPCRTKIIAIGAY